MSSGTGSRTWPPAEALLLLLERKALPPEHRMYGARRFICTALCLIVMGFGLYMVPSTLGGSRPQRACGG
jgi:hypothetical protein